MTIYNLGSINADLFYAVPHLPQAGETLAASHHHRGLGGKGANMSVAAARAGSHVSHIGAVGEDGAWAVERLLEYGVDTRCIHTVDTPTGHAVITIDEAGENAIVLSAGANRAIPRDGVKSALAQATDADIFLFQNETNQQAEATSVASARGMRIIYAAAPFDPDAVQPVLPMIDILVLNAVEAGQLEFATGQAPKDLPVRDIIVTLGSEGALWIDTDSGREERFAALPVTPVDTTGAGDTFTGYLAAGLDRSMPMGQAIGLAAKAAALMVTRKGTADVIPDLKEVQDFSLDG